MSSPVAPASQKDVLIKLRGIASKLERTLSTEGREERALWDGVHGTLGKLAGYLSIADSSMPTEDLRRKLREKIGPESSLHPDVAALLPEVRVILGKRIGAEKSDSSKAIDLLKYLHLVVTEELDMFPLCDYIYTTMIQDYIFHEEKVNHMIRCSGELSAPNAPYTVLSIVGPQSSGKSYLLNQLFGSDFPVMNARTGRNQTTQGILISRCIMPSFLVLDIEGFDGRERGQDTKFEKQAALFALTTSDLMMVNMSVHDVGREQGGGATLFKTIFQERTKLPPCLTKIIVVLRHYDGETPVDILEGDVMKSLEEMWTNVHERRSNPVVFKDYIEIKVVALPEKSAPDFRKQVRALRKLLSESNLDQNRSARVPASSFAVSSKMLWDQIRNNKRLDLPSHKLMVATVCCQRIVEEAIDYFASDKDCKLLIDQESPRGFKEASDKLLESIIAKYDKETDMYDAGIRNKEREKLEGRVNKRLTKYSRDLLRNVRVKLSEEFKKEFDMNLRSKEESADAVLEYPQQMMTSYRDKFTNMCKELTLLSFDEIIKICGELQDEWSSHSTYQMLCLKERRALKDVESARQLSRKELQEAQAVHDKMKLESRRILEEINCEREKRENQQRLDREEAEREHQRVNKKEKEKNKRLKEEKEKLKQLIEELEAKQESASSCTIL